jgi:hypothetical protein
MKIREERIPIVEGVLFGDLSEDLLMPHEIQEIEKIVYRLIEEKVLTEKMNEGKIVFSGKEKPLLN